MNKLVFLPGFLGAKEDWDGVREFLPEYETTALDLFDCDALNTPESIIVGYSMGGRVALQLQRTRPCKHVIVIGAHPGLATQEAREERLQHDERIACELETRPFDEFLDAWYENPLFAPLKKRKEVFAAMLARRKMGDRYVWVELLRRWSLGHFEMFIPANATFLYGELDEKYAAVYRTLPPHTETFSIPNCGHAAHLENPEACAAAIRAVTTRLR